MDEDTQPDIDQFEEIDEAPPPTPSEYVRQVEPLQKAKRASRRRVFIFLLILLMLGAAGAYYYQKRKQPVQPTPTSAPVIEQPQTKKIALETKHYTSNKFDLEFDYPTDWTLDDSSAVGTITIISPQLDLPSSTGTISGKVTLKIRPKKQLLPEFQSEYATAATESQKISYSHPTLSQNAESYVSFLNFDSETTTPLVEAIYVTGNLGYLQDQVVPKTDMMGLDPIISLQFTACDGTCEQIAGIPPEAWDDSTFGAELKKLLSSFILR